MRFTILLHVNRRRHRGEIRDTTAVSAIENLNVAGVGSVELTLEERCDGQPFLLLHGGAGPYPVADFARLFGEKGHNCVLTLTHPGFTAGGYLPSGQGGWVQGGEEPQFLCLAEMDRVPVIAGFR